MTRTLVEFHGILADHLAGARARHDSRPAPGEPGYLNQESQDVVTVWRHLAHVVSTYANGAHVRGIRPTWEAFWSDGMDCTKFLRLVTERSRVARAVSNGGDTDTMLVDDSVRYWEYGLALSVMTKDEHAESARKSGIREAARRLMLETEIGLSVIMAYTGLDHMTVREAMGKCQGERPVHPESDGNGGRKWESHPLFDLITANRPTF